MDKEAVMSRVMENWRTLSVEEKAVWRKRAVKMILRTKTQRVRGSRKETKCSLSNLK